MATTRQANFNVTDSAAAPTTNNLSAWPAYTEKDDLLKALCLLQTECPQLLDVVMRLSNTDTSSWTNKGSIAA